MPDGFEPRHSRHVFNGFLINPDFSDTFSVIFERPAFIDMKTRFPLVVTRDGVVAKIQRAFLCLDEIDCAIRRYV